jgi:hypothetical protein
MDTKQICADTRPSLTRRGRCALLSMVFALVALATPMAAAASAWNSRLLG